ncbi:Rpr2-domain-containing protein [Backusella circina FSU 941]|nr:Rpr2-domain-containing protein [Backusella circina FSU 941]
MSGPTNQQNATLDYLFNASFSLVSTVPSLSSFYMKQLQTSLKAYELKNHATLQKTSCSKCGTIKLPGVNHKVEIKKRHVKYADKKKNDKKNNKQQRNQLVENCLACGHVKTYYGSQRKKLPRDMINTQVKPEIQQQKQQMIPEKKKKNKSKKNNLQALLSKQKQSNSSPMGGSLNDFLSSL